MSGANEGSSITSVLKETRMFPPPQDFQSKAHIKSMAEYEELWNRAKDDPEGFWGEQAGELLDWFEKWDTVLDYKPPFAKWFVGGKLNASYNCLDRHLKTWRKNKAAIVWKASPVTVACSPTLTCIAKSASLPML